MLRPRPLMLAALALPLCIAPLDAHAAFMQSYQASGNLGLEVSAVSSLAGQLPAISGTFSLSQIPPGASVQKAFVYTADWGSSAALNLVFGSSGPLGVAPFDSDASTIITHLYAYQWDVTPFVIGAPLSYSFTIGYAVPIGTQGNQIAGAALVVVWQDPLAPLSTVTIVHGARQVGEGTANIPPVTDTETATFTSLPAGSTSLYLFTVSDDSVGTGEVVRYNGTAVGGPIDENLGLGASLLQINTSSLSGSNTVSVTSSADHFGWILSTSIVTPAAIPAPATLPLLALGLPAFASLLRRRAPRALAPGEHTPGFSTPGSPDLSATA